MKKTRNNEEAIEPVAKSIKEFGFKVPIVIDKNNIIIAGHTRYKAAKKLELNKVPCIVTDDLTEDQVNAFRLADNKVATNILEPKDKKSNKISWKLRLLSKTKKKLIGSPNGYLSCILMQFMV